MLQYVISSLWRNLNQFIVMGLQETFLNQRQYYVYILSNWNHKVIYIGITNNLARRIYEHKHHRLEGFTDKYNVTELSLC